MIEHHECPMFLSHHILCQATLAGLQDQGSLSPSHLGLKTTLVKRPAKSICASFVSSQSDETSAALSIVY